MHPYLPLADADMHSIVSTYGPYGFGVVVVVLLVHAGLSAWQKVGKPALDTRLEIAKQQTTQVQALERMQVAGEKMQQAGAILMERLERIVDEFKHGSP